MSERLDRDAIEARLSEVYADGRTVTGWSYKQHISALLTALDVAEKALEQALMLVGAYMDPSSELDYAIQLDTERAIAIIRGQADLPDSSEVPGKASE